MEPCLECPMTGAPSAVELVDQNTLKVCAAVRDDLQNRMGNQFTEYTAISVRKQLVAGMNYFVKIHVGGGNHIHVRIYEPLPGNGDISLTCYETNKIAADPLDYFECDHYEDLDEINGNI